MNDLFLVLLGLIILINVVRFLFHIPPSTDTDDSPLRMMEDWQRDSPTYLNDPLGGPRPRGGPLFR